jgi:hypothetical protein
MAPIPTTGLQDLRCSVTAAPGCGCLRTGVHIFRPAPRQARPRTRRLRHRRQRPSPAPQPQQFAYTCLAGVPSRAVATEPDDGTRSQQHLVVVVRVAVEREQHLVLVTPALEPTDSGRLRVRYARGRGGGDTADDGHHHCRNCQNSFPHACPACRPVPGRRPCVLTAREINFAPTRCLEPHTSGLRDKPAPRPFSRQI